MMMMNGTPDQIHVFYDFRIRHIHEKDKSYIPLFSGGYFNASLISSSFTSMS